MRALVRVHDGLKVVFCFMHATPSHYYHHAALLTCIEHIRWKIPGACVNACWVYSVGIVSKMKFILSITLLIFFTLCVDALVELVHSSLDDWEDIVKTYILIKLEVSTILLLFSVVVRHMCLYHCMLSVLHTHIPTDKHIMDSWDLFITVQSCDVRK